MALRILARGAEASKDVIEPLVKSGRGFIGIFEKVDQVGDGSFEVIGAQSPLKCADPATFTRSETANGGAWSGMLGALGRAGSFRYRLRNQPGGVRGFNG